MALCEADPGAAHTSDMPDLVNASITPPPEQPRATISAELAAGGFLVRARRSLPTSRIWEIHVSPVSAENGNVHRTRVSTPVRGVTLVSEFRLDVAGLAADEGGEDNLATHASDFIRHLLGE